MVFLFICLVTQELQCWKHKHPFGNKVVGTDSRFDTVPGNFSFTERLLAKYSGAAAMYFVSKKLKKRHNITDERKALYEAAETWVDALKGRQYLGTYNSIAYVFRIKL